MCSDALPSETLKQGTRRSFQGALCAYFEVMRETGEPIPEPTASGDYVEVAA
jgi:hypothetical protein